MPGISASKIGIPFSKKGMNWSSYWTTRTYAERVLHYFGTNLIAHWPLDETSGVVAAAIGPSPANNNIVPNGGFEGDATGYLVTGGTMTKTTTAGEFHSGAAAAKVVRTSGAATMYRTVGVIPGKKYVLKFWCRGDGTNAPSYDIARQDFGAWVIAPTSTGVTGTDFVEITSVEFTAPANFYNVYLEFKTANATDATMYIDDVSIIPSETVTIDYLDGEYKNATLNQAGFRTGENSIYLPGTNPCGVLLPTLITKEFPADIDTGTLLIWAKPDLDALTDGAARYAVKFKTNNNTGNYCDLFKDSTNNLLGMQFKDDTMSEAYKTYALTTSSWTCLAVTWSPSAGVKFYVNGVQSGVTSAISGTWTEIFDLSGPAIGAADRTGAGGWWKGNLSHCVLGKAVLSNEAMLYLGQPL